MWKWINIFRKQDEFTKWAKALERKLKGEIKEMFREAWPSARELNETVRASFIFYWELRSSATQLHHVAQPMTIGYLAYLADGAQAVNRTDIIEILNNMIRNIPRINVEINNALIPKGEKDEEE
jgi:hypothetical protein|tara:strand:- start:767 stop:1138 length:372 start_codon:yes stop_codon:yes gene_type:complete